MKVVSLVSGGIDSAVSTALALERKLEVVALYFQTTPFGDEYTEKKTKEILGLLSEKFKVRIKLFLVPHGKTLTEIAKNIDRKFNCIICRRLMLKKAEAIALEEKAFALVTGESLGQVASQTLSNLSSEFFAVNIPIVRPLLGMDKLEIEALAKKFSTYHISMQASACCKIPEKPATVSNVKKIEAMEKKLNVEKLVRDSLKEKKVVFFGN